MNLLLTKRIILLLIVHFLLVSEWISLPLTCAGEPLQVGTNKQVFLDGRFLESSHGVTLTVNRPLPTGEKLIVCDKPWEQMYAGGYMSVIQEDELIKMWYECGDQYGFYGVAYAISRNGGATWEKPVLGLIEYDGSKENNIVLSGVHGTSVFCNRPGAPEDAKYCLFSGNPNRLYISPDGYQWEAIDKEPFLELNSFANNTRAMQSFHLDSQNVMFWDTRTYQYTIYPRINLSPGVTRDGNMGRTVGYASSKDLHSFSKPEIVLENDQDDPPNLDFYTSGALQYPYAQDAYYMFPATYYHLPSPPYPGNDGPIDLQFAASRDGKNWIRPDRRPLIRQGQDGKWNCGCLYAGYGITRDKDTLSLYYVAQDISHAGYKKRGYIRGIITRASYRLDGFISLDAEYGGGEFITPVLVHDGDELVLNVDCSAGGTIVVELQDESGMNIPSFSLETADVISTNTVEKVVSWKGITDISNTKGKPLKIHMKMRDAKIYSFQWRKKNNVGIVAN